MKKKKDAKILKKYHPTEVIAEQAIASEDPEPEQPQVAASVGYSHILGAEGQSEAPTTKAELLPRVVEITIPELTPEQVWEIQLEKKIRRVFFSTPEPPILFKPNRKSRLDVNIDRLIQELRIRVPILHIEKNKYLIGSNRCNCSLKGDVVLVRVGGGYERLDKYLAANRDQFELTLVTHMSNNEWTLDQVVEKLLKGERIKTDFVAKRNIT